MNSLGEDRSHWLLNRDRLSGTVIVTGANRGLGLALVGAFLDRNCLRVIATARSTEKATDLKALAAATGRVAVQQLDVTSADSIDRLAATLHAEGREIDVVVNNAGIGPDDRTIMSMPIDDIRLQLETHALGPLQVVRAVSDLLHPGSVIVNVSSLVSGMRRIAASYAGYAQAKALQNAITRALARTLEPDGIIVFAVHPFWVATEMGGDQAPLQAPQVAQRIVDLIMSASVTNTDTFRDHTGEPAEW